MKKDALAMRLENSLTFSASREDRVGTVVTILAETFAVTEDEVAIFLLDESRQVLNFLWPLHLKKIGFIPYSSHHSLAARTIRENQPYLENDFPARRHASMFERIRLDATSEKPDPIQRILSVPAPRSEQPLGVIQISRKGTPESTEPFSQEDLDLLAAGGVVIGCYI